MTSKNDGQSGRTSHLGRVVSGVGGMMRAVAGVPAGVSRDRRGTFLVMVIGTLALLAVIAVAHFAIGQADRRASGALVRADAKGDIPTQVASYIKQLISDDLFTRRMEDTNALLAGLSLQEQATRAVARRVASDIPMTDWRIDSTETFSYLDANGYVDNPAYYTPAGRWSDNWLASTEPMWLSPYAGANPAVHPDPTKPYKDYKDWGHISNLSPDGRFVNLWNLRNNFGAESGFGNALNGKPRTSANLYVLDSAGRPVTQTDFGASTVNATLPGFFANRQRGMFMPASTDFRSLDINCVVGKAQYHPYMYADADGSGYFNARWTELTDARDVNNPINSLVSDGSMRWFVAARVIDLSGLVNVNTATDSSQAPGAGYPVGISPAEIDLKRVLSMPDVFAANGAGYEGILQSSNAASGDNYVAYDKVMALRVGAKAYDATMRVRVYNEMPPATPEVATWVWPTTWNGVSVPAALVGVDRWLGWRGYASSISGASFSINSGEMLSPWFSITDSAELLSRHGVNDIEVTTRLERAMGGRLTPNLPATTGYSPVRDNRGEELEATRIDTSLPIDPLVAERAMLAVATDVRRQLTTVSGARPLASAPVGGGSAGVLQGVDVRTNIADMVRNNSFTNAGNIAALFDRVYVNSLAPALRIPGVWQDPAAAGMPFKTLFYGHNGPQLGIFASAFMTANLVDALKPVGSDMGKYTVVFDSSTAQDLFLRNQAAGSDLGYMSFLNAQGLPAFPWFRMGLAGRAQISEFCLDTKNSTQALSRLAVTRNSSSPARSAGSDKLTVPPAVNVFGTRAQPFITQVGCYTMYSDAPRPAGDVDTVPVVRGQPPSEGITLNGTIVAANPDFLVRVLAFQIHNPFDEAVTLSSQTATALNQFAPNTDAGYYYVTLQDDPTAALAPTRAVKLVSVTHPAVGQINLVPISIGAGQTIVCYTLSQSREDVVARINAVSGGSGGDAVLQGWLDTQLRAGAAGPNKINALHEVPRIDPIDHAAYTEAFDELAQGALAGTTAATSVQLWKSERLSKEILDPVNLTMDELLPVTTVGGVAVFPRNRLGDDRMMDRFALGSVASPLVLDRRLLGGNNRISGTFAGPQSNGLHTPINSNTGITLTLWATAKRPTDPQALFGAANIAAAIPLGGIPAYCIEPKSWATNWNERKTDLIDLPGVNVITLDAAKIDADPVAAAYEFATWQARQINVAPMSPTMSAAPWAQRTADGLIIPDNREATPRPYQSMRQTMLSAATADNGFGVARSFTTILPGQLANDPPAATLRATDMLLPMCVGPWEAPVDHDAIPQTNGMVRWTTLAEAWAIAMGYEDLTFGNIPQPTSNPLSMYANVAPAPQSRGSQNPRPVTDYGHLVLDDFVPFYDSDSNGKFDPSIQLGGFNHDLRMGLGIPVALSILDSISTCDSTFGGLSRATPGLINVNTATHEALRCLPLLTPPDAAANLLWTPAAGGFLPMDPRADVAASVVAYRDKVPVDVLPGRGNGVTQARFMDTDIVDGAVDQVVRPDIVGMQSGRARQNRIDGVRELAGFASPGEMMCVLSRNTAAFGSNVASRDRVTNIDHLAFNVKNDSQAGIASLLRKDSAGNLVPDAVQDKYEEKLMIAAALSNTTSVRSDIFACWFVIRGYTRDDCEGLGASDPMVPSVERRFLMILDRSNITRIGDEPKVLLFQEVPM